MTPTMSISLRDELQLILIRTKICILGCVLCLCIGCRKNQIIENFMTDQEVERLVASGDDELLHPETLSKIDRRHYTFLPKYLHDENRFVRNILVNLLHHVNQKWCFTPLMTLVRDPLPSIRVLAAEGIFILSPEDSGDRLMREIEYQTNEYVDGREQTVVYLALGVGNTGESHLVDELQRLSESESDQDVRSAFQQSLAKLGFSKELKSSDPHVIQSAMQKVEYIDNSSWIKRIIPLLSNTDVALSFHLGRGGSEMTMRICDFAVNTLSSIDRTVNIPFEIRPFPEYSDEEVDLVRQFYRLPEGGD